MTGPQVTGPVVFALPRTITPTGVVGVTRPQLILYGRVLTGAMEDWILTHVLRFLIKHGQRNAASYATSPAAAESV